MGLFGKKKTEEPISEDSEEVSLKENLETEVETLQKEFREKQEELTNILEITNSLHEQNLVSDDVLSKVKNQTS